MQSLLLAGLHPGSIRWWCPVDMLNTFCQEAQTKEQRSGKQQNTCVYATCTVVGVVCWSARIQGKHSNLRVPCPEASGKPPSMAYALCTVSAA